MYYVVLSTSSPAYSRSVNAMNVGTSCHCCSCLPPRRQRCRWVGSSVGLNVKRAVLPSLSHSRNASTQDISSRSSTSAAYRIVRTRVTTATPFNPESCHTMCSALANGMAWHMNGYVPSSPAASPPSPAPVFIVQIHNGRRLPSESPIKAPNSPQTSSTLRTGRASFQSAIAGGSGQSG